MTKSKGILNIKKLSNIDIDNIVKMYTIDKYSMNKISTIFNVTGSRIKKILKDRNLLIENRDKRMANFTKTDIENIVDLYLNKNYKIKTISKLYNVNQDTIKNNLKKLNILKKDVVLLNKEDIIKLYLIDKISINKIAKKYNIGHVKIRLFLEKENIYDKNRDSLNIKSIILNTDEKNNIVKLYIDDDKSIYYISNKLNISQKIIKKILTEKKLFLKDKEKLKFLKLDYNKISELYLNENMSLKEIGAVYNVSETPIKKILNKLGIYKVNLKLKTNQYSQTEINDIISKYKSGMSKEKIGTLLHRSLYNIEKVLIENGVWVEGRDFKIFEFTEEIKEKIIEYYLNKHYSPKEIANLYNVNYNTIRRFLKMNNIKRKLFLKSTSIVLSEEQEILIKDLYLNKYHTPKEISEILNIKLEFIKSYIYKSDYCRNKSEAVSLNSAKNNGYNTYEEYLETIPEFLKYRKKVLHITRKQPIENLLNYNKRGNYKKYNPYHLDHKYSIAEGFKNGIYPEIIGNINNLEFITALENAKKRDKCSISLEKLLELINNR